MMDNIDTLCITGGAFKGISYLGVLKYLIDDNYIDIEKINKFIGVSVGSIISLLFVLGISIDVIINIFVNINFSELFKEKSSFLYSIFKLGKYKGIYDSYEHIYLLRQILKYKMGSDTITFKELYEINKKKFFIIGTNISKVNEIIFSYKHTPNIPVMFAIKISTSVPIIFKPVKDIDTYYGDGSIINNVPLCLCNRHTTLGITTTVKNTSMSSYNSTTNKIYKLYNSYNNKIIKLYKLLGYKLIIVPFNKEPELVKYLPNEKWKKLVYFLLKYGKNIAEQFIKHQ